MPSRQRRTKRRGGKVDQQGTSLEDIGQSSSSQGKALDQERRLESLSSILLIHFRTSRNLSIPSEKGRHFQVKGQDQRLSKDSAYTFPLMLHQLRLLLHLFIHCLPVADEGWAERGRITRTVRAELSFDSCLLKGLYFTIQCSRKCSLSLPTTPGSGN